jgi:membrane complex biogenesis BtpA family protein
MAEAPQLFAAGGRTLIGMLHLPPLPGSALHDGTRLRAIERRTVEEATELAAAGFDALMIQNAGHGPPGKDADLATVAQMAAIARAVCEEVRIPLGVNVLKNGVETAFAIASAVGASFVRIKVYVGAVVGSEGIVEGRAQAALAERRRLGLDHVAILADILDRTSQPLADVPLAELADWAVRHGHAEALVITGRDVAETLAMLAEVRSADRTTPLVVGGGATPENAAELLQRCDALIVGSSLKETYADPISGDRARAFVAAVRAGRPDGAMIPDPR